MNIDPSRFDNALQIGGIRTGTLDFPNPGGGQSCRVAHFNTGSGLRFTVAIDRGGDIVEASYNDCNLAYLTPNDYRPPSHAHHQGLEWLVGWPGGLMTTAGPVDIGEPRSENGRVVSLHGRHSNTPASVEAVVNPDPLHGRLQMHLAMVIRDSRMFGPNLEVNREISCDLGQSAIRIRDVVTNRGDEPSPHAMLYHVNLGYPLLDEGAAFIYRGSGRLYDYRQQKLPPLTAEELKVVPPPDATYRGAGEQVVVVDAAADDLGAVRVGLVNPKRSIGLQLSFAAAALPRLGHWLHYGPRGSYVAALEPFCGSLFGTASDNHPAAAPQLAPGESKEYALDFKVLETAGELEDLARHDGPLTIEW